MSAVLIYTRYWVQNRADRGEFVTVTGPSGCEKSTMLHILGGLDRPTSGTVSVDHEDLYEMSENGRAAFRRNRAGIVYQFYNLVPELTVEENIALPCILNRQRVDRNRLDDILDFLGLQTKRTCFPEQLHIFGGFFASVLLTGFGGHCSGDSYDRDFVLCCL